MKKKSIYITGGLLSILILAGATALFVINRAEAQQIPDGAYFADVKKLSKGSRPACLPNNYNASQTVDTLKPKNSIDDFGVAVSIRIIDMPAGVTETTVNSFDGKVAKGTMTYSDKNQKDFVGDLKNLNYAAFVGKDNKWELTSFIACNK